MDLENPEVKKQIWRWYYEENRPVRNFIAPTLNIPETMIYSFFKKWGWKVKGRSESRRLCRLNGKPDLTKEQFLELLKKYGKLPRIAKAVGYSRCYLQNCLKRFNIEYEFARKGKRNKIERTVVKLQKKNLEAPDILDPTIPVQTSSDYSSSTAKDKQISSEEMTANQIDLYNGLRELVKLFAFANGDDKKK